MNFIALKNMFLPFLVLLSGSVSAQNSTVNPKGSWFLGAETGINIINNYEQDKSDVSLQGGLLVEYYFGKQWSVVGRIKYFTTGLSFYKGDTHSGSWFDLSSDEEYGTFRGAVIAVPVDLKWEFRLYKNLRANVKTGFAYHFETKSEYHYPDFISTDYPKNFGSFNAGFGLNYFVSEKLALYADYETYLLGGYKGSTGFIIFNLGHYPENNLLNFGVKYRFP